MKGKRILVADDEESLLTAIDYILKKNGGDITTVKNGREAFDKILAAEEKSAQFHLLITDLQMPEMTGFELIDQCNKAGILIPTIAITGFGNKEAIIQLMRMGCADYIDKPFQLEELMTTVNALLDAQEHEPQKEIVNEEPVSKEKDSSIAVIAEDGWQIVTPFSEIVGESANKLRLLLVDLMDSGHSNYRFDFKYVENISSVALSVFFGFGRLHEGMDKANKLEIVNANEDLCNLFKKTNMEKFYDIHLAEGIRNGV